MMLLALSLLVAIWICGSMASSHPTAIPVALRRRLLDDVETIPDGTPISQADAQARFTLYTALVAHAPTPIQDDLRLAAFEMFRFIHQWPEPVTAAQAGYIASRVDAGWLHDYADWHVRWTNRGPEWVSSPQPIRLARGLTRVVLVHLERPTADPPSVLISCQGAPALNSEATSSTDAAGTPAWYAVPVTVTELSVRRVDLQFDAPNGQRHVLSAPVEVQEPAVVQGRTADKRERRPVPARLYALGSDRQFRSAEAYQAIPTVTEKQCLEYMSHFWRSYRLPFSYTDGSFRVLLPPGKAVLAMERGPETRPEPVRLTLKPGETRELVLTDRTITDPGRRGWYAGDTHIHWAINYWHENEAIDLLKVVQRAEGISVVNNLTLYQHRDADQGGPFIKPDQYPMGPVPGAEQGDWLIWMGEEYRNDSQYGHVNMLAIRELIQPIATGAGSGGPPGTPDWPLNRTALEECHRQGGINAEAHGLGPLGFNDIPANVIMGLSDLLDQTDPDDYYRLLNSGIRIGLGNGSDHPARVAGSLRCYAHIQGRLTYRKWIDALKAGRTFTTSGPLLFLTVNGKGPGEVLNVKPGESLRVRLEAVSRYPLGRVQIIRNGEIIADRRTPDDRLILQVDVHVQDSLWLAARCSGMPNEWNPLRRYDIAHTSAVYALVDRRPVLEPASIRHWIEYLEAHIQRIQTMAVYEHAWQRQEQVNYLRQALRKYQALLHQATGDNRKGAS